MALHDLVVRGLLRLRNRHFFGLDLVVMILTPALALALRTDGAASIGRFAAPLALFTLAALACKLIVFIALGLYARYWRYASVDELGQIVLVGLSALALEALLFFGVLRPLGWLPAEFPRSIPFLDGILTLLAVGGSRFSVRLAMSTYRRRLQPGSENGRPPQPVLIMGAGDAGAMIVRELQDNPHLGLEPVGFLDDDLGKHDVKIHGVPVLGDRHAIPAVAKMHQVRQVIIAMPTAPGKAIRAIVKICEDADLQTKIVPGLYELIGGAVTVRQLREVRIEDLLRREPVQTDIAAVRELLRGKRVLVTGGGGSIGSELCRQILCCEPARLIILGHGENSIFEIAEELKPQAAALGVQLAPVIAGIRFPERMRSVFEEHRPQIVFHAAAHKHVPLMESNPAEAITNNVGGTRNLLNAAMANDVERFVMISTDKAVNPTSIMGASKRAAELLVHAAAAATGRPYVAVRFGNVLGSRGSVALTFKRQIAAGGPVTVTHPEMKRYFMTIPEAVQLVLQAAVLGQGGEVFVLDMGEPVKIADLARDLIELSGLEVGHEIDIKFTGLRPGEKMFEELFIPGEVYGRTAHYKIFVANNGANGSRGAGEQGSGGDALVANVDALITSAQRGEIGEMRRLLREVVPEYWGTG